MAQTTIVNPHFDHGRIVWQDAYSGVYQPVDYSQQFDLAWQLYLEQRVGFHQHPGVETSDPWIDALIGDLTGVEGYLESQTSGVRGYRALKRLRQHMGSDPQDLGGGGRLALEPKFSLEYFRGKRCLDIGCGAGRWTRTLLALGATVKSIDLAEHGLQSTRRYNEDSEKLNVFDIVAQRPDLHGAFDFTLCWGVVMCTHDPQVAFANAAATVKEGGALYTMIYAPEGMHNTATVLEQRRYYHTALASIEAKLAYASAIAEGPGHVLGYLDMLHTFYNWVVPEDVIYGWYSRHGFQHVFTLNAAEPSKCAYHILGTKG